MSYTEQDVERVAAAMFDLMIEPRTPDQGNIYHRLARAALEAMEREPLPFPSMVGDRDALRELIYDDPILTDDQKREVYRIAEAIRVRVRSNYPELWDIGDRPDAWAYPARILLGMVPRPLEDVLDDWTVRSMFRSSNGKIVASVQQRLGVLGQVATGLTIDEAIRAAVERAKGGE